MLKFHQYALAIFTLAATTQIEAIVLFDANADPDGDNGAVPWGVLQPATDFEVAEDSNLTDVRFWTLEGTTGTGSFWDGTLYYTLWGNGTPDATGGVPSQTPLAAGLIDCSTLSNCRTATGVEVDIPTDPITPFNQYLYEFELVTPFTLRAFTRYWLGIYLGATTDGILWQYTNDRFGYLPRLHYTPIPDPYWPPPLVIPIDVAFELEGYILPVPPTAALLLTGLVGLRLRWRSTAVAS